MNALLDQRVGGEKGWRRRCCITLVKFVIIKNKFISQYDIRQAKYERFHVES